MINNQQNSSVDNIRAIKWEDDCLILLDQRLLPEKQEYLKINSAVGVADAIRDMVVRGAPAIGITAAYGFVLALKTALNHHSDNWQQQLQRDVDLLNNSRPTAVNLGWALKRMQSRLNELSVPSVTSMLDEAHAIHEEDISANLLMGKIGSKYLQNSNGVLTHCNTGSLATGGFGTALGVIRTAYLENNSLDVYASETRPWLQGSRLTAWELEQDNIPVTLIADSAAAYLMQTSRVNWVITGADRVAANGDVANKIGTYSHAVNARQHEIGFMVVAPISTIDLTTSSGDKIEIEQRGSEELISMSGKNIAPNSVKTFNPVFDITPSKLITVLVTELGAIDSPNESKIRQLLRSNNP
ncbi:MAG: S-methyl-5-thioribose-1-phosphate isomerase [Gammaproteobacteria bacterium]|jgi:methylthioribose-1-phosphate isomerase